MTQTLASLFLEFPTVDALDRQILAAHALGKTREYILAHPEHIPTLAEKKQLHEYLTRRKMHEPIAYITGHREFFGLDFLVTPDTLIPRPETELLVEQALYIIANTYHPTERWLIADIGTGSGNIIISLLHTLQSHPPHTFHPKDITWYGLDISTRALTTAKRNAKHHNTENSIHFLQSNLLEQLPLNKEVSNHYTHILFLANLPYLSQDIYNSAPKDVREYEPKTALLSKEYGLRHYHQLLQQLQDVQQNQSTAFIDLFLEISPEQKQQAQQLIQTHFPEAAIHCIGDLSGKPRVIATTITPTAQIEYSPPK